MTNAPMESSRCVRRPHDPVCGMAVNPRSQAAGLTAEHEGSAYFFCGRGCKLEFLDDPQALLRPGLRPAHVGSAAPLDLGACPSSDPVADQALSRRRHRAGRADPRRRAGDHRPGRRQRRRQEHAHEDPARPAQADRGLGDRAGHGRRHPGRRSPRRCRLHAGARLPAAGRLRHRVRHPHGADVRAAPAAARERAAESCATSGCTRSAIARSGATRPA